jgi:hypothetical protein
MHNQTESKQVELANRRQDTDEESNHHMMSQIDNEDDPDDVDEQIDSSQVVLGFKNLQEKSFGQKSLKGFGHSPRQQVIKPI